MKLRNDIISIEIAAHGAELVSLVKDGREYMWNADASFWNRHAPILFPAVGKPFNNELHIDGSVLTMKQHGFARDSEFGRLPVDSPDNIRLRMLPNALSDSYPYPLALECSYRIVGKRVEVTWTVDNLGDRPAFFQIGAHPGFMLPDYNIADAIHGYVEYYDNEGHPVSPVVTSYLKDGNRLPLATPRNIPAVMPIEDDTFSADALMFENGQVATAVLCDKEGHKVLSVSCPQAEAYGIWAPHKPGCPFVCLEPWCGICDTHGFTSDISQRTYIHQLPPQQKYQFRYGIEV